MATAVANGEKLPLSQKEISSQGHAIEARIYAEDPRRDFLPATGRLLHLAFPAQGEHVRVDAGVEQGGEITPWYDPMIAKLVVHGRDRAEALERLRAALGEVEIAGVTTNVEFLRRVAASRAFSQAELDTGLIERNRAELVPSIDLNPFLANAALAELAHEETEARRLAANTGDPHSPWHRVDGWQLNAEAHHDFVFVEAASSTPCASVSAATACTSRSAAGSTAASTWIHAPRATAMTGMSSVTAFTAGCRSNPSSRAAPRKPQDR